MCIKDIGPDSMSDLQFFTPESPARAPNYPRHSHLHESQSMAETERLVRAFCAPVEDLWTYVQTSGYHPMGWQNTDVLPRVREAHELIGSVKRYLVSLRGRPTTEEVTAILQKLEEVAGAKDQVSNHRDTWPLQRRLQACGPPLKAYVDYIDPEQSESLPWRNGWKTTVEGMMHDADVSTLLRQMRQLCV